VNRFGLEAVKGDPVGNGLRAVPGDLQAILRQHGQEHLLGFWTELNLGQRESLCRQIERIDFPLVRRLYDQRQDLGSFRDLAIRAQEPPAFRLLASKNRFSPAEARARGRQSLAAAEVGAVLVAGGQGTRLGFDHPKGMFAIGPVSGRTLFQIHIEKILATARRHGVRIPLYLMTSPATHDETVEFLARHERFGLAAEDLHVFCQGTMPAVDAATGRLLLEAPDRLAVSPNGHGGMLAAFAESGAMADAQARGLRQLFYFQVDNPLVDIAGPEYIGYHVLSDSEMTSQVIAKRDPLEKVGNVVDVDGRLMVIEYSDLPEDIARKTNPDGSLAIWAGSIAVHVFDLGFLCRAAGQAESLPYHVAHKKVAYIDATGAGVNPAQANAIKFERFIFDLMPAARNAIVVEIDAATGFAPLKNASGAATDTPESVKAQISDMHRSWLRAAGVEVADGIAVEIAPGFALDAEELRGKVNPGLKIIEPKYWSSFSLAASSTR
jgi:UDP-N-acetylglucosamine/UDP-N-acetylgalactosamine diphosphorylase